MAVVRTACSTIALMTHIIVQGAESIALQADFLQDNN
jgi:hypothetical protein